MGGTIAVILRTEEGKVHKMRRWTNSMSDFVDNMLLVKKDPEHVKSYLKVYYDMKDELKEHLKTCKKDNHYDCNMESPMAVCYAYEGSDVLAPEGYGLLVVDLMKDSILSMQNYTSFGQINSASLMMTRHSKEEDGVDAHLEAFLKDDRVLVSEFVDGEFVTKSCEKAGIKTIEDCFDYAQSSTIGKMNFVDFKLDLSPFTIFDFEESPEGADEFKQKINDLGFEMTDKDNRDWSEWCKMSFGDE